MTIKNFKNQIFLILTLVLLQNTLLSQNIAKTPYKCVINHLNFLNDEEYNPKLAANSFYLEDSTKALDLAIKLKQVYDGLGYFVPVSNISDNPFFVDSLTGKNKLVIFPIKLPEIYLEKIDSNWYYSPQCYDDIQRLYNKVYPFGSDLFSKYLPHFNNKKVLGLYIWQYLGFLVILVILLLIFFILNLLLKPLLVFITDRSFKLRLDIPLQYSKTSRIISLLIVFYVMKYAFAMLNLPINLSMFLMKALDIINIVLLSLLIYRVFDIIMAFVTHFAQSTKSKMDDQVLPIVKQIVKLLIILGAVLKILVLLNINITALIAGISIGGLALALAAQDTVRNFIGSLMIFIDKPFQIEDWIEIDNMAGTVEEVGFRSTRIRLLDTSVISIPNGIISNKALKNKGLRVYRIFDTTLGITYDTPREYIEAFVKGLRKLAIDHPEVADNDYIFLKDLGAYSINILFRVFLKTNVYKEEMQLKEELTFLIMELAEELGVRFAFPSQTIYVEQLPGQKDLIPKYNVSKDHIDGKLSDFFDKMKSKNDPKV